MSRVALRFSGRSALVLIFTPAPFIRRAGALLSGFAIFVSATTPMFAGSGTFTISPTVMCVGGTVSVTVNSPCVSTEGSSPWVSVGFSLVGSENTSTNISLYTNSSGAWTNSLAITTAGDWTVAPTDSCGDSFGSSNLIVVQLNDIKFLSGPTNSGWTGGPDTTTARNYEALKSPSQGAVVTFGLLTTPTNALAAKVINWSNATPSADNLTATVDATKVGLTNVFASTPCGTNTNPYTVWIFWGNITYNTNQGPRNPLDKLGGAAQFQVASLQITNGVWTTVTNPLTQIGPFQTEYGAPTGITATNGSLVEGYGVEIIGQLAPAGIGAIVGNIFTFDPQMLGENFWKAQMTWNTNDSFTSSNQGPDSSLAAANAQQTCPTNDLIFAVDYPFVGMASGTPAGGTDGTAINFTNHIYIGTNPASDPSNWYFRGKCTIGQDGNTVTGEAKASQGSPALPSTWNNPDW